MTVTDLTPVRESAMPTLPTPVTTAAEALEQAGLAGWNVQKLPMWADARQYPGDHGRTGIVDESTYKTAGMINGKLQLLGTVGDQYQVVQNEQHAEFLDEVVRQSGGEYTSATQFRNGRLVYIGIKLPDTVLVGGQDPVNLFLNGINSHDGSTHFMLNLSPERAWCANQLPYFRQNSLKFRHSGDIKDKVADARRALGITLKNVETFAEHAERLVHTDMPMRDFQNVLDEVYPVPAPPGQPGHSVRTWNNYTKLRDGFDEMWASPANALITGTAWGGLQAALEHIEWTQGSDKNRAERIMTSRELERKSIKLRDAFSKYALAA